MWTAIACFYWSLLLSLWALITAAHQLSVLGALHDALSTQPAQNRVVATVILGFAPKGRIAHSSMNPLSTCKEELLRRFKVCIWQLPLMASIYAWIWLLVGLTIYACAALFREPLSSDNSKVHYRARLHL